MRRWAYPVFFIVAAILYANPLPLTVSEIGLMLRTGYSSETMMQELSKRHFADTLDQTKEQTLVKAGASAELIDKLRSGIYSLSAEKTAAVQEQMTIEAQHRAAQVDASRRSDAAYQAEVLKKRTAQSQSLNSGGTLAISEFLKHDLIQIKNGSAAHADETALENKRLIALYFSAEWCGPCRQFTPKLVDYYKRIAPEHPEFEIVFYSSDRSQYAMEKYMLDESMPWLAIDFAKLKDKEVLKKNAGNGIPSLVLVDSNGNVISSSYADGKFRGPQQVLADLDAIFAGKTPGRLVDAR
jgi:nucleoredoxin